MNQGDFHKQDDATLVKLSLKNQDNFLYLVQRYKEPLLRYIRRITNIYEEELEDVLQNVFIKAYLNLRDYNTDLKFSSWIYRIAHNEVIDNYRKFRARPQTVELNLEDNHLKELVSDSDIVREFELNELKEKVALAINSLDIKYKEVLVLKFIHEQSYQEISDVIRKPIGTVASRVNKAKKELRKELLKDFKYEE